MEEEKKESFKKGLAKTEKILTKIVRFLTKTKITLLICFVLGFFLVSGTMKKMMKVGTGQETTEKVSNNEYNIQ